MLTLKPGLHQMKYSITIHAPVERCYEAWIDSPHLPEFIKRIYGMEYSTTLGRPIAAADEIEKKIASLDQNIVSPGILEHWLVYGPGCKLYELEKTIVMEIPNRFYCTTSADPQDLSVQSSLFFFPDDKNKNTYIEWEISFWTGSQSGKMTKLVSDILMTGEPFYEDCLQDLKTHLEAS